MRGINLKGYFLDPADPLKVDGFAPRCVSIDLEVDRDRIRQEIRESLGWRGKIWRIWSTDWFRNPQAEAQRRQAGSGNSRTSARLERRSDPAP